MSDFLGALSSFGASRLFRVALSIFGWHCKLFGCDFLARGGVPGCAFCNGLLFSGRWASPLFWQFEKFGAGKVFLLFADVAFCTGEGLLVYGMDARYRRGVPGVRDAFSEAFGVKNRRFWYGHPFFHLLPSARQQIHPDIFFPSEGCPLPRAKEKPKTFQSSKKITKLASQEKDSII